MSANPHVAMHTVMPANSTAEPDVATESPTARSTGRPPCRAWRWRLTMNSE